MFKKQSLKIISSKTGINFKAWSISMMTSWPLQEQIGGQRCGKCKAMGKWLDALDTRGIVNYAKLLLLFYMKFVYDLPIGGICN
jgi:hypothetical protein